MATSTAVALPWAIALDPAGQVFVASSGAGRVYRISTDGVLHFVAGSGQFGFAGDGGPALQAKVQTLEGIALDTSGNVYFSDADNDRVRVVLQAQPTFQVTPAALSFSASAGSSPTAAQSVSVTTSVAGVPFTISNNLPLWLSVSPMTGALPSVLQVIANPGSLAAHTRRRSLSMRLAQCRHRAP